MGSCVSISSSSSSSDQLQKPKPSANVVSANGDFRQYPVPITVARLLELEEAAAAATDESRTPSVLCSSDALYFDEFIPALDPDTLLEPDQIYFLLPASKLRYRLSASDMAALAVKASLALDNNKKSKSNKVITGAGNKSRRISPMTGELDEQSRHKDTDVQLSLQCHQPSQPRPSSMNSVRRVQRYSSRRCKAAVRLLKRKLSTIDEGSVLESTSLRGAMLYV